MRSQILLFGTLLLVVAVTSDSNFDSNVMSAMMWLMSGNGSGGGGMSPARSTNSIASTLGKTTSCKDSKGRIYRTADGTCNNIDKPTEGSSMDRYKRDVKPQYNDRSQEPRIKGRCLYKTDDGCYRPNLPSARAVSVVVHTPEKKKMDLQDPASNMPSTGPSISDLLGAIGASPEPATSISPASPKGSINDLLGMLSPQKSGQTSPTTGGSESVLTEIVDRISQIKTQLDMMQTDTASRSGLKGMINEPPMGSLSDRGTLGDSMLGKSSPKDSSPDRSSPLDNTGSRSGLKGMVDEGPRKPDRSFPREQSRSRSELKGLVDENPTEQMPDRRYPGDPPQRRRYREDNDRNGYRDKSRRYEYGRDDNGRPDDRRRDRYFDRRERRPDDRRGDRGRRPEYRSRDDGRPDDRRGDRYGRPDDRRRDRDRRPDDRRRDRDRRPDDRRGDRDRRPDDRSRSGLKGMVDGPDRGYPGDLDRRPDDRRGGRDSRPDDRSRSGLKGMVDGPDRGYPGDGRPDDGKGGRDGRPNDRIRDRRPDDRREGRDGRPDYGLGGRDGRPDDGRRGSDGRPDDGRGGRDGRPDDGRNGRAGRPDGGRGGRDGRSDARETDRRPDDGGRDRRPDDRISDRKPDDTSGLKGMVDEPKKPDDRSRSGLLGMVDEPMKPDDRSRSGLLGMVDEPMKPDDRSRSGLLGMVDEPMKPDDRSRSGLKGIVDDPMKPDDRSRSGLLGMVDEPMKPDDRSRSGLKGIVDGPMKPDDRSRSGLLGMVDAPIKPDGLFAEPKAPGDAINNILGMYGLTDPKITKKATEDDTMYRMRSDARRTDLLRLWTIFIEHEVTATAIEISDTMKDCCSSGVAYRGKECFPIPVPLNDRRFKQKCLNFLRSRSVSKIIDSNNPREQQNMISAFIDGSAIYGSDIMTQDSLRDVGGYMLTSEGDLLPRGDDRLCRLTYNRYFCFKSGDDRLNLQPGLIIIHTLFVRIHNKIVASFEGTTMSSERKFQEARRIVIALIQKFTYEEYLPEILNIKYIEKYNLDKYTYKYDPSIEVRISNVFATAAIKFVDALTPDSIVIRGRKIRLRETYNNPEMVFEDLEELIEEMLMQPTEDRDRFISEELTDHFMENGDRSYDEVAMTIQRGRDHGLPPYNWFRQFCGLPIVRSFSSRALGDAGPVLRKVYKNVNDIDAYTGAMAEPNLPGSLLGETFSCIIARQFRDLKFGDSFFYLSNDPQRGFTREQQYELSQVTLSTAMCAVFELEEIQDNPFRVPSRSNPLRECEGMINFLSFLEEGDGPRSSLLPRVGGVRQEYEAEERSGYTPEEDDSSYRELSKPAFLDRIPVDSQRSGYDVMPQYYDSSNPGKVQESEGKLSEQGVETGPYGSRSGLMPRLFNDKATSNDPTVFGTDSKYDLLPRVYRPIGGGTEAEVEDPGMQATSQIMAAETGPEMSEPEGRSDLMPRVFSPDGSPLDMGSANETPGPTRGIPTFSDGSNSPRIMPRIKGPATAGSGLDPAKLPGVPLHLQPKSSSINQVITGKDVTATQSAGQLGLSGSTVDAGDAAEKTREQAKEGVEGKSGAMGDAAEKSNDGLEGRSEVLSSGAARSADNAGEGLEGQEGTQEATTGEDGATVSSDGSKGRGGADDAAGGAAGDGGNDCCSDNSDDSKCSEDDKKDCKKSDK